MFMYMSKWQVWTSWSFFTIGNPLATNTTIVSLLEIKNQKNHFGMTKACIDLLFAVLTLWSLPALPSSTEIDEHLPKRM